MVCFQPYFLLGDKFKFINLQEGVTLKNTVKKGVSAISLHDTHSYCQIYLVDHI